MNVLRKSIFLAIVLAVVAFFGSHIIIFPQVAALGEVRASKITYDAWNDSLGTIRFHFFLENVSDDSMFLSTNDFVLRKSGHNTVKANSNSGGFAANINDPVYDNRMYEIYPGDKIAVSLDFMTKDNNPSGWSLYFSKYGNLIRLGTIN